MWMGHPNYRRATRSGSPPGGRDALISWRKLGGSFSQRISVYLGLHRLVRGLSLVKDIVRTQGRLRAAWQAANDKARGSGWIA